jgi:biopolymer transport protein ExbB
VEAFWNFVTHHWYFAVPMFLMSFVGIFLVIWRLLLNINGSVPLNTLMPEFQEQLEAGGVDGALRYCQDQTAIIPKRLFTAGLENAKQGMAAVKRGMASAIELEILPDLNFLLAPILAIAKIATMVGLLGTVISMINVFDKMNASSPAEQASEIGLALFATALGLVTAIPLVFTHVLFKAWVARYEVRMKSAAQKLLLLLQAQKAGAGKGATGSSAGSKAPDLQPTSKR